MSWSGASRLTLRVPMPKSSNVTVAFTTLAVPLLVLAGGAVDFEVSANEVVAIQPESSRELVVRLFDLTSVRRAFEELVRRQGAMTDGDRVAAWTDFS